MKKKILLLFIICFIVTGCSSDINITIKDNYINETDNIYSEDKDEKEKLSDKYKDMAKSLNFEIKEIGKGNQSGYKLSNNFEIYDFGASGFFQSCFSNFLYNYLYDEKEYTIDARGFYCSDYLHDDDSVVIKITSDYEVVDTNADSFSNGIYYWKIDKNSLDKKIYFAFKYDFSKYEGPVIEEYDNYIEEGDNYVIDDSVTTTTATNEEDEESSSNNNDLFTKIWIYILIVVGICILVFLVFTVIKSLTVNN